MTRKIIWWGLGRRGTPVGSEGEGERGLFEGTVEGQVVSE